MKPLKNHITYLADIFTFMNEVNKKLQGEMITLIRCKNVITAFISKLALYQENTGQNVLSQFPSLFENNVTEDERLKYYSHLHHLEEDMHIRFADLFSLNVTHWVIQPFSTDAADLKVELQNQFIDLQNDGESKINFKEDRYDVFWCKIFEKYPLMWNEARAWILSFPTSYLVEKGFSAVTLLQSKQRNRLSISKRGDMRMYLTNLSPNIKELAKALQAHSSH